MTQSTSSRTELSTCPVLDVPSLLQAIYNRVRQLIEAAGQAGVNVVCLQEAW